MTQARIVAEKDLVIDNNQMMTVRQQSLNVGDKSDTVHYPG
jgi:hypothetical protein